MRVAALLLGVTLLAASARAEDGVAPVDSRYPAHWWKEVAKEGAPSWEILPQEAKPGEVILSKRHELGKLSNFAATPFEYRGKRYASLEGFWQCMKYPEGADDPRNAAGAEWKLTREQVAGLTAFEAHKAGTAAEEQMKKLGIEWISFEGERIAYKGDGKARHLELIEAATRAKLEQNPEVKKVLLSTGDLVLKPDHHQKPDDPPAWRYYDIWMKLRAELQKK